MFGTPIRAAAARRSVPGRATGPEPAGRRPDWPGCAADAGTGAGTGAGASAGIEADATAEASRRPQRQPARRHRGRGRARVARQGLPSLTTSSSQDSRAPGVSCEARSPPEALPKPAGLSASPPPRRREEARLDPVADGRVLHGGALVGAPAEGSPDRHGDDGLARQGGAAEMVAFGSARVAAAAAGPSCSSIR